MRLAKAAGLLAGSQLANVIFTLVARVILGRFILGADLYGQFSIGLNAVTVSSRVFSFGLAPAGQYYASKQPEAIQRILRFATLSAFALGVLISLLGWFSTPWLASTLFSGQPQAPLVFQTLLFGLPFAMAAMMLGVLLVPVGKIRSFSVIQAGGMLPFILLTILLAQTLPALQAVSFAQIGVWVYLTVIIFVQLRPYFGSIHHSEQFSASKLIQYGLKSWPNVILSIGVARLSTLGGAAYITPVEASLYTLALQLVEGAMAPQTAIGQLLLSKSASDSEAADKGVLRALRLTPLISLAIILIAAIVGFWAIPMLFGKDFSGSYGIMLALFVAGASHASARILGNVIAGKGQPGKNAIALSTELIVLLALIPWLTPRYGVQGLVTSTVTASLVAWSTSAFLAKMVVDCRWSDLLLANSDDVRALRSALTKGLKPKASPGSESEP